MYIWHVQQLNIWQYEYDVLAYIVVCILVCIDGKHWIHTSIYSILTGMYSIHTCLYSYVLCWYYVRIELCKYRLNTYHNTCQIHLSPWNQWFQGDKMLGKQQKSPQRIDRVHSVDLEVGECVDRLGQQLGSRGWSILTTRDSSSSGCLRTSNEGIQMRASRGWGCSHSKRAGFMQETSWLVNPLVMIWWGHPMRAFNQMARVNRGCSSRRQSSCWFYAKVCCFEDCYCVTRAMLWETLYLQVRITRAVLWETLYLQVRPQMEYVNCGRAGFLTTVTEILSAYAASFGSASPW